MAEEWRVIPGFENYEVSDQGRVRNRASGHIHKPNLDGQGYPYVNLQKASKQHSKKVHRLVLLAFIGPSDLTCNHKNGIRHDNRLENLEYLSMRDNLLHSIRVLKTVDRRGERAGGHKLTEQQVREMRRLWSQNIATTAELAKRYGVAWQTVNRIVNHRGWKHVK